MEARDVTDAGYKVVLEVEVRQLRASTETLDHLDFVVEEVKHAQLAKPDQVLQPSDALVV